MFSPYYAWARGRGAANPLDHCAVNVALYGPRGKRWTMTERPRGQVRRSADSLTIGSSTLSWDGTMLTMEIDEVTAPVPHRIRGTIRLYPASLTDERVALDTDSRHYWLPIAPCSHVEVDLRQPALRWSGSAYLDSNVGAAPLENSFKGWSWSRAKMGRDTAVLYDVAARDGAHMSLAMRFDPGGGIQPFDPPQKAYLPSTRWRIRRETRADAGHSPKLSRTLEDGPFYARSLLSSRILGESVTAIHESLSLDRFRSGLIKAMLPFRMPRWPL